MVLFTLIPVVAAKGALGAHCPVTQVCNNCAALAMAEDLAQPLEGVSAGAYLPELSKMALALYGHPILSFTQKAPIALYENTVPFDFRLLGPDQPEQGARYFRPYFPLGAQDRD